MGQHVKTSSMNENDRQEIIALIEPLFRRIIREEIARLGEHGNMKQFVKAEDLLKILWPESSRPTLRWLRDQQKARKIPWIKSSRFVFFQPEMVMEHLKNNNLVKPR